MKRLAADHSPESYTWICQSLWKHAVSGSLAPAGYIGYDNGQLTENKKTIFSDLFDEIEKAHLMY